LPGTNAPIRAMLISKAYVSVEYRRKAELLAAGGLDLTLVAPPSWKDERGDSRLEPGEARGYRLEVLPLALNGHFHLHWFRGLNGLIRRLRPDIVHMEEEPYNVATALALRAAQQAGAQSVFFTWQNLNRRYPLPFRLLERYCYRTADAAIAGNRDAEAVLRAKGYVGPISVLPQFGVDETRFRPASEPPSTFTIGYVGRFVTGKGVDLLLRAAAALGGEWRLRLVGSGPERESLAGLATDLGLADRLTWVAPVPSAEVPEQLQSLSCLVLPSLSLPNWKEQFGRVLIEAMACGVPVVGSDSGEIPHVIGDAGLVFPEGDVEGLGRHLERLRADPSAATALGRAARERVLAQYTQSRIAAQTAALYEGITRRR